MPRFVSRSEQVANVVSVRDRLDDVQVVIVNVGPQLFRFADQVHIDQQGHQFLFDVLMRLQPEAFSIGDHFDTEVRVAQVAVDHSPDLENGLRSHQLVDEFPHRGELNDIVFRYVATQFSVDSFASIISGAGSVVRSPPVGNWRGPDFGNHVHTERFIDQPVPVRFFELRGGVSQGGINCHSIPILSRMSFATFGVSLGGS